MIESSALVLLSGGQDSTTCLYWALKKFKNVSALGFDYGQKNIAELAAARKIANRLNVFFTVKKLKDFFSPSSLTCDGIAHSGKSLVNENLPASFVPGRNILFMAVAGSFAAAGSIKDIVMGSTQINYESYPDNRRNTIDAMQETLSLGLGVGEIAIHTPLMFLDKAQTWGLAKTLGCLQVIIEDTVTDYNGSKKKNEWGMGELNNGASIARKEGYEKAKEEGLI